MITMKTDTQIKFDTIIKEGFTPLLKPLSFKKKALNYYHQLSEVGHIINIQKDRYSHRNHIKFRINIGIFEPKFWAVRYDFKHTGQVPDYLQNLSVLSVKLLTIYEGEKTFGMRFTTILMNKNSSKKYRKIYNNIFSLSLTNLSWYLKSFQH